MPRKSKSPLRSVQRGVGKANVSLQGMAAVLEQQTQTLQQLTSGSAEVADSKSGAGGSAQLVAIQIARAQLQLQKDQASFLKKISDGQNKQIEALQKGNKDWKSVGEKFKDFRGKISDAFDPNTIKKKLLGPFTMFKGVRDKVEDLDYVKRMKSMGDTRSSKALTAESGKRRGAKEDALRAQAQIDKFRRQGASDEQIQQTDAWSTRNKALARVKQADTIQKGTSVKGSAGKSTPLPKTPSDTGQIAQSTTDKLADQQSSKENQLESIRLMGAQTDLLQQIANNTSGKSTSGSSAGGKEDKGSAGGLAGFGFGLKALGAGLKSLGQGAGKGIEGLFKGLAAGAKALANPAALIGLTAFTLAMIGIGAALRLAAPAIDAFAPVLIKFADVIGNTFLAAIKALPGMISSVGDVIVKIIGAIGDVVTGTINAVTSSIERLSKIDGNNLAQVGAGLLAVSGGLVAFAASNVLAGIGNLVTKFLNLGGDSPIDQLLKLANSANDLNSAAQGIGSIGEAMRSFSNVDPKQMQAINDFPWVRATAFVAAGGAMSVAGAKVYSQSKGNADEQAKVDGSRGAGVSQNNMTQVNQNSVKNTTVKPSTRNQESSQARYLQARY